MCGLQKQPQEKKTDEFEHTAHTERGSNTLPGTPALEWGQTDRQTHLIFSDCGTQLHALPWKEGPGGG